MGEREEKDETKSEIEKMRMNIAPLEDLQTAISNGDFFSDNFQN